MKGETIFNPHPRPHHHSFDYRAQVGAKYLIPLCRCGAKRLKNGEVREKPSNGEGQFGCFRSLYFSSGFVK